MKDKLLVEHSGGAYCGPEDVMGKVMESSLQTKIAMMLDR